ncbi:MAG: hypothetical protein AAF721_36770 [Myxococcota bacterium]
MTACHPVHSAATVLCAVLLFAGCDRDVGVVELVRKLEDDGTAEPVGGQCLLVDKKGGGGFGTGGLTGVGPDGPGYATEIASTEGNILFRYFVAPEGQASVGPDPGNAELAVEISAEVEFFESGETKHVEFETYDGIAFEVFLWGQPECEYPPPTEPPDAG